MKLPKVNCIRLPISLIPKVITVISRQSHYAHTRMDTSIREARALAEAARAANKGLEKNHQ